MKGCDNMIDNVCVASHQRRSPASPGRRLPIALVAIAALHLPAAVSGQTNTFPASGNVGIGTTSPYYPLHLSSYDLGSPSLTYHSGNTMFGLDVPGNVELALGWLGAAPYGYWIQSRSFASTAEPLSLNPLGGNVGIGTTNPQHLLHVAGTIGAEEVIVSSTGADYVFQPGYHLSSLGEVSAYIKENHHLPGVPSAAEMRTNGLSLGETQVKLLAKVEELTLHMIEADDRNSRLERQNRELQERIARLEAIGESSQKRPR